jgi:hypothetical protein
MRGGGRSKSRLVFELGGKRRVGECKVHGEKYERVREEGHIVMIKCFDVTCDSLPRPSCRQVHRNLSGTRITPLRYN